MGMGKEIAEKTLIGVLSTILVVSITILISYFLFQYAIKTGFFNKMFNKLLDNILIGG